MILLCIAIHGDNKQLAREQLTDMLIGVDQRRVAGDPPLVYRAWIKPTNSIEVDEEVNDMPEVVK